MTEQLFKAYDNDKKEWVEDFYINEDGDIFTIDFDDFGPTHEYVRSAILVRATGLRDNKRTQEYPDGQMIFEGDIFTCNEYPFVSRGEKNYFGVVEYVDDVEYMAWYYDVVRISDRVSGRACGGQLSELAGIEIEVLGNIFDNPELLEVVKNA